MTGVATGLAQPVEAEVGIVAVVDEPGKTFGVLDVVGMVSDSWAVVIALISLVVAAAVASVVGVVVKAALILL